MRPQGSRRRPDGDRSVALGFVVYKPTSVLVKRITAAYEQGFGIFVFDNSPQDGMVREALRGLPGSRYHTMGRNLGLGVGLSSVCATAFYEGYNALVFFDQDTVFAESTLEFVSRFLRQCEASVRSAYSAVTFKSPGEGRGKPQGTEFALNDVRLTISSGSLFFLPNLRRLEWHNTRYFVDCVDYEFCLRSARAGLRVGVCYGAPGFDHRTEQDDTEVVILGRRVYLRRYPNARIVDTMYRSLRLMGASLLSLRLGYFGEVLRFFCSYTLRQVVARFVLDRQPKGPSRSQVNR
jgi:rhamnosyltransferase